MSSILISYQRWLRNPSTDTPFIDVRELSTAEAAELALLDLAFSDDEWLDEEETTEYARPALLLEDFDDTTLDDLYALEDDDTSEPWHAHLDRPPYLH